MTLKELRKSVNKMIQEILGEDLDENILHMIPSNEKVISGGTNRIENFFPEYSEEDGTFAPQKVTEKQY